MQGVAFRLVGALEVRREDAAPGAGAGLGSRKARRLLALLAVSRGSVVSTARIVDALWPDTPPRRPVQDVRTLVSRLRGTLGRDVIVGGRDGYRLADEPVVRVDLDEAARLVAGCEQLSDKPRLAASAGHRALDLLAGDVVLADEPDTDWVRAARDEQASLLRAARHATAGAELAAGDPAASGRVADAAVLADPFDEAAVRLQMAAEAAAGEPARALAAYQRLRVVLADELGVQPAPQTRAVYQAVLREQPVGQDTPTTGRPAPSRLVGRDAEVAAGAAWSEACAGRSAVLLVTGEGGIGKTRLAAEVVAAAEATGARVLTARCYASERSLFLQPLLDALGPELAALPSARLRMLAGTRPDALVNLLPELAEGLGPGDVERASPDTERRRAFEAVAAVLRGLAAERPTLLLLDDLHNAGLATVELLAYLARRAGGARLLVLGVVRTEEGAELLDTLREPARRIDLGPLPAEAVGLLAAATGRTDLTDMIVRRTRGHTLFVVETLRGLAAGESGVPESLQAVVLARLRRAGADTEEVLRAGAVLGATVDPAAVAGLLDLPAHVAAQRCAHAADARLLVEAGRAYEFANDLVQEILYATTAAPVRATLHRRAADLLTADPAAMARHAAAVEDWPRTARALLLAAQQTRARYALADAEAMLSDALAAAQRAADLELVGRAHLARGQVRMALDAFGPAVDDFDIALRTARQAGDRRLEMLALRELAGHGPIALGQPAAACVARAEQGLRVAEVLGDRAAQASLLSRLAVLAVSELRFADAVELGNSALRVGRREGSESALTKGLEAGLLGGGPEDLQHLVGTAQFQQRAGKHPIGTGEQPSHALARRQHRGAPAVFDGRVQPALQPLHPAQVRVKPWCDTGVAAARVQLQRLGHLPLDCVPVGPPECGERALEHGPGQQLQVASVAQQRDELVDDLVERAGPAQVRVRGLAPGEHAPAYLLRCVAPLALADGTRRTLVEADALLASVVAPQGSAWLLGLDAYLCVARAWLAAGEPRRARRTLAPLLSAARRERWVPALACAGLVDGIAATAAGDPGAAQSLAAVVELAERHGMPLVAAQARCSADATPSQRLGRR